MELVPIGAARLVARHVACRFAGSNATLCARCIILRTLARELSRSGAAPTFGNGIDGVAEMDSALTVPAHGLQVAMWSWLSAAAPTPVHGAG